MNLGSDSLRTIWDHSGEDEVSLKQIYAHLFNYFGFAHYRESDIWERDNFVGSDAVEKDFFISERLNWKNSIANSPYNGQDNFGLTITSGIKNRYKACGGFEAILKRALTGDFSDDKLIFPKGEFHWSLTQYNTLELFVALISYLRNDTFDIVINRFFRARKKKVDDTLEMLAKNLHWRMKSHLVEKWTFEGDAGVYFRSESPELINAFKTNKAFIRGKDRGGCPIVVVRVRDHFAKDCPEPEFEKFIVLLIEWARLELKPYQRGVDSGSLLFDMTDFGLKNADFAAIKFLTTAFEANFPECLGTIWIHNAPWIFNAVWKIIKSWIDPRIASKIRFTTGNEELELYIDPKFIPRSLGGADEFVMKYQVPTFKDSDFKPKDKEYRQLVKQRTFLIVSYFQATMEWVEAKTIQESDNFLEIRLRIGAQLAQNYIRIDPYFRRKGLFERIGETGPMGF